MKEVWLISMLTINNERSCDYSSVLYCCSNESRAKMELNDCVNRFIEASDKLSDPMTEVELTEVHVPFSFLDSSNCRILKPKTGFDDCMYIFYFEGMEVLE